MPGLVMDPVVTGDDGATMRVIEERFNRFQNKNTWWRHDQNGTMAEFDRRYEEAMERVRARLGKTYPIVVGGKERVLDATFTGRSPADASLVLGHYAAASKADVKAAVAAAKKGFPSWSRVDWRKRCELLEKAADAMSQDYYDFCAAMSLETGKTRFESSIDVDEAIDFLRFYAFTMREMGGFEMLMGKPFPNETCHSRRRPYGVFAVFCPFNFPVAITVGMTAGALVTGNTVVLKPSQKGAFTGWMVFEAFRRAGAPPDALQYLTGTDQDVSAPLLQDPEVDGIVFTGSKKVGMMAYERIGAGGRPKPLIAEMGGKNTVIVTAKADMDKAVQGVWKSAFGFSGQKCSACSRVYVERSVAPEFLDRLKRLTDSTTVGHPWKKGNFMGPVIEEGKVRLMAEVVKQVKADGGRIVSGGAPVDQDPDGSPLSGNYMRPTVVTDLPKDHRVFREEFFMPFVAVAQVESLEEAVREANKVDYGLTSGIMSEDPDELALFFDRIEAGVVYANRAAGASTAAVVNGQSFGGWKLSGTTGNGAGGRYYLQQFTRERSETVAV